MQIRTTMMYHLTPVRMSTTKMSTNNNCWEGCREKEIHLHWRWKCKLMHWLWRTVWGFFKKLKIELPYDAAIPLLDIYLEKNSNSTRYMHPSVHCSIIYNSSRHRNKVEYSSAILKEIIPFPAAWIDLDIFILTEVCQKERGKYHMISLICESKMWCKWTYLWNRNRLTDTENRLVVAMKGRWGRHWLIGTLRLADAYYYV